MERSWSSFGGILNALGGSWRSQERSGRCWRLIWQKQCRNNAEKMMARRNAQACSRWFTIDYRQTSINHCRKLPRPGLTRSAPLSGAADLIAHAHSAGPGNAGPRALGDVGPKALGRPLGGLLEVSWRSFLTSWGLLERSREAQMGSRGGLGGLLEASWSS